MRAILCSIYVAVLIVAAVSFSTSAEERDPSSHAPERHLEFSRYTDPGQYAYLYDKLPESLDELCLLIKKQLIHPFDAEKFAGKLPEDRTFEDMEYPTVSFMLEELLKRDERGLTVSREPGDRLLVACVHHSMLLASILRHRGIPVRIRAGFATYIGGRKDLRVSHVVCEVWDGERSRWILIDPDRERIDFPRDEFEFAHEVWFRLRKGNLGSAKYISRYGCVDHVTAHLLFHDLSYVIGTEEIYWEDPPIVSKIETSIADLSAGELQVLDRIADLLVDPDDHLDELTGIQTETSFLQLN